MPGHENTDSMTNAPDDEAELQRGQRDDGQERVRDGVAAHHAPRRQADRAAVVM